VAGGIRFRLTSQHLVVEEPHPTSGVEGGQFAQKAAILLGPVREAGSPGEEVAHAEAIQKSGQAVASHRASHSLAVPLVLGASDPDGRAVEEVRGLKIDERGVLREPSVRKRLPAVVVHDPLVADEPPGRRTLAEQAFQRGAGPVRNEEGLVDQVPLDHGRHQQGECGQTGPGRRPARRPEAGVEDRENEDEPEGEVREYEAGEDVRVKEDRPEEQVDGQGDERQPDELRRAPRQGIPDGAGTSKAAQKGRQADNRDGQEEGEQVVGQPGRHLEHRSDPRTDRGRRAVHAPPVRRHRRAPKGGPERARLCRMERVAEE
jgi:hypothetical protein